MGTLQLLQKILVGVYILHFLIWKSWNTLMYNIILPMKKWKIYLNVIVQILDVKMKFLELADQLRKLWEIECKDIGVLMLLMAYVILFTVLIAGI